MKTLHLLIEVNLMQQKSASTSSAPNTAIIQYFDKRIPFGQIIKESLLVNKG